MFKKGDTVRRKISAGDNAEIHGGDTGEVMADQSGTSVQVKSHRTGYIGNHDDHNLELVTTNNSTIMASLPSKFALLFKGEPQKSFIKAGVMDDKEMLTPEGQTVFLTWLLKENGEKFKEEVVDPILAEETKD